MVSEDLNSSMVAINENGNTSPLLNNESKMEDDETPSTPAAVLDNAAAL